MRYTGSKIKIADSILPFINSYIVINNIDTYIEPFMGGCNIVDKVICSNKYAYDKNKYIVALFQHLQNGGELPDAITREHYLDCKAHYKANDGYYPDWYLAAVGFLAGLNEKFYDDSNIRNSYNEEQYMNHYQSEKRELLNQIISLTDVKFNVSDYKEINPKNSLVYADPPYAGKNGYSSVTKEFNHKEFWDIMRGWSKENIVLISEENAPDDFDILWECEDNSSKTIEKLFIHSSINDNKNTEYNF